MYKQALIDALAAKTELTKADSAKLLDALLETIVEKVSAGEPVVLVGFGTFKSAHRPQSVGRNPGTGEPLTIKETSLPKFAPGAVFKGAVADAFHRRKAEKAAEERAEVEKAAKQAKAKTTRAKKSDAADGKNKKKKEPSGN